MNSGLIDEVNHTDPIFEKKKSKTRVPPRKNRKIQDGRRFRAKNHIFGHNFFLDFGVYPHVFGVKKSVSAIKHKFYLSGVKI